AQRSMVQQVQWDWACRCAWYGYACIKLRIIYKIPPNCLILKGACALACASDANLLLFGVITGYIQECPEQGRKWCERIRVQRRQRGPRKPGQRKRADGGVGGGLLRATLTSRRSSASTPLPLSTALPNRRNG